MNNDRPNAMRNNDHTQPSRRSLFAMAAVGGLALGVGEAGAAPGTFDPAAPTERLRSFMLMRGALDDRLVIGFLSGRYYGVIDDALTPLYGVVSATFARYRPKEGGGYECVSQEIAYFTDLETGKAMDQWRNPMTGETVAVPVVESPPARLLIAANLTLSLAKPMPGGSFTYQVSPGTVAGDDFWFVEETAASFQVPGQSKPAHYSEIVTLHARKSDLAHVDAKRVPCQTSYTSVVSWRPWLKMGDRPGHLMGNGFGRYDATLSEIPAAWLEATTARHPALLKDPGSSIAALWAEKA